MRIITTLKKMRGHSAEAHGERGEDEKLGSSLWSSAAMTQLCTLAVVHSGTCDNSGHGWGHFQNKRLQFTRITYSSLHHTLLLPIFRAPSLLPPPPFLLYLCLYIHFSSLLSPLHLPRDLAWVWMSYAVYECSIYLVGSARTGSPYICHCRLGTLHGCHGNHNAPSTVYYDDAHL